MTKALRTVSLVALLVTASLGVTSNAQTLHLVNVADTEDINIGVGTERNAQMIKDYVTSVASLLNFQLDYHLLVGSLFSCASLEDAVQGLQVNSADIVVFYYAGHGFRKKKSGSKFPLLYCDANPPYPDLSNVAARIAQKGARLTIAVADSCNVVSQESPPPIAGLGGQNPAAAQVKKLFLGYKGVLIMSGAIEGQYSWYLPSGGYFTNQLMTALVLATSPAGTGTWKEVIDVATKEMEVLPPVDSGDGTPPTPAVMQKPQADDRGLERSTQ